MRRIAFGTIIMACLLMVGCKSDDEPESTGSIAVTGNASNVSLTEATVYGNASVARLGLVASQCVIGVEYDVASDDFSSPATYVAQGVSGSLFTCNLSNLLPNTTYQYRAYVEAQGMVYYGEKESFTTQSFGNIASCESFSNLTTRTADVVVSVNTSLMTGTEADKKLYFCGVAFSESEAGLYPNEEGRLVCRVDTVFAAKDMPYDSYTFTAHMDVLSAGTLYYYCAYTSCNGVAVPGSIHTLNTREGAGQANGYGWMDLGLSSGVCWATSNLGAASPEEAGGYYAWGETKPKETYTWENYKLCNGTQSEMVRYNESDGLTVLSAEDDAATVNMGTGWRMPSNQEIVELLTECRWTWTTEKSVPGYRVTGPNKNSIFLPSVGYRDGSELLRGGSSVFCWSRNLSNTFSAKAFYVGASQSDKGCEEDFRYYGQSIRPVYVPD